MNLKKPKFWDYKEPNIYAYLLLPLTYLVKILNYFNLKLKLNNNLKLDIDQYKNTKNVRDYFNQKVKYSKYLTKEIIFGNSFVVNIFDYSSIIFSNFSNKSIIENIIYEFKFKCFAYIMERI